jgi:hypothetical protein
VKTGTLTTANTLRVAPHLRHLCGYLVENRMIENLHDVDERCLSIYSRDVLARVRSGDRAWETMTPDAVAELIKRRGLLGYRATVAA